MAAIDMANITKQIEKIISEKTSGYRIERNKLRNEDPNLASQGKGLIQIFRGGRKYVPHSTGARPWLVDVSVIVDIQYSSMMGEKVVEDRLMEAEGEILDLINADKTLNGSVAMVVGYGIDDFVYESEMQGRYFQASRITILAQVRA